MFKTRRLAGGESRGQCTLRKLFRPRVWVSGSAREAPGPLSLHSSDALRCGSLAVESAWARAGLLRCDPLRRLLGGEDEKRADAHRRAIEQRVLRSRGIELIFEQLRRATGPAQCARGATIIPPLHPTQSKRRCMLLRQSAGASATLVIDVSTLEGPLAALSHAWLSSCRWVEMGRHCQLALEAKNAISWLG
jgi:hypothetical protein